MYTHALYPRTHHREVGVHGIELHVDLFVDTFLGVLSVVLPHLIDCGHCDWFSVASSWREKLQKGFGSRENDVDVVAVV